MLRYLKKLQNTAENVFRHNLHSLGLWHIKIIKFWKDNLTHIHNDFRSINWIKSGFRFLLLCWASMLMVGIVFVGVLSYIPLDKYTPFDEYGLKTGENITFLQAGPGGVSKVCSPEGDFSLNLEAYNYWNPNAFFKITLGSGNLTFQQAKAIDIIWDFVVGRGGQGLMALISWRIFARYITAALELSSITYRSFMTIFMQNGPSILETINLARDFVSRQGISSKSAMIFIVTTMGYVLAFPTLASAMTGYAPLVQACVLDRDNNCIAIDMYEKIKFTIHDGERVHMGNNYHVTGETANREFPGVWNGTPPSELGQPDPLLWIIVSDYINHHGVLGQKNSTSTFINQTLSAPVLNISAFPAGYRLMTTFYPDYPVNWNVSEQMWIWSNQTYDDTYVKNRGRCQNNDNRYKWGFSFIQLFVNMLFLLIWTVGLSIMWLSAHRVIRDQDSVPGNYKALLQLASAVQDDLGNEGTDLSSLTEKELVSRVCDVRGGRISSKMSTHPSPSQTRILLLSWIKKERWWLLTILATFVPFVPLLLAILRLNVDYDSLASPGDLYYLFLWILGPMAGVVFSAILGIKLRSRYWVVIAFSIISALYTAGLRAFNFA